MCWPFFFPTYVASFLHIAVCFQSASGGILSLVFFFITYVVTNTGTARTTTKTMAEARAAAAAKATDCYLAAVLFTGTLNDCLTWVSKSIFTFGGECWFPQPEVPFPDSTSTNRVTNARRHDPATCSPNPICNLYLNGTAARSSDFRPDQQQRR